MDTYKQFIEETNRYLVDAFIDDNNNRILTFGSSFNMVIPVKHSNIQYIYDLYDRRKRIDYININLIKKLTFKIYIEYLIYIV